MAPRLGLSLPAEDVPRELGIAGVAADNGLVKTESNSS